MLGRTSKILTSAVVALALSVAVVGAVTTGPNGKMGGMKARGIAPLQRFSKQLNLTQDQTAKVRGILVEFHADAKAVLQSDRTREAKATEMMRLRDDAKGSINSVLTLAQQDKAENGKLIDKLLMPRRGMWGLQRLFARLNLTPDQKVKVREIMRDSSARIKAVRQNTNLPKEEKMARIKEIRRGTIDRISALLTPEQKDKLDQWLKAHQRRAATGQV